MNEPIPNSRRSGAPPMPKWVKYSLIAAGALFALLVVLKLTGGDSGHGPGRHGAGSGATSSPLAAAAVPTLRW